MAHQAADVLGDIETTALAHSVTERALSDRGSRAEFGVAQINQMRARVRQSDERLSASTAAPPP